MLSLPPLTHITQRNTGYTNTEAASSTPPQAFLYFQSDAVLKSTHSSKITTQLAYSHSRNNRHRANSGLNLLFSPFTRTPTKKEKPPHRCGGFRFFILRNSISRFYATITVFAAIMSAKSASPVNVAINVISSASAVASPASAATRYR